MELMKKKKKKIAVSCGLLLMVVLIVTSLSTEGEHLEKIHDLCLPQITYVTITDLMNEEEEDKAQQKLYEEYQHDLIGKDHYFVVKRCAVKSSLCSSQCIPTVKTLAEATIHIYNDTTTDIGIDVVQHINCSCSFPLHIYIYSYIFNTNSIIVFVFLFICVCVCVSMCLCMCCICVCVCLNSESPTSEKGKLLKTGSAAVVEGGKMSL